jgi:type VI protein secretion system component VasK
MRPGQVQLVFTDRLGRLHQNTVDGDWAWFRVLAPGVLKRTNSTDRLRAEFDFQEFRAVYQITIDRLANPFGAAVELFRFRAPERL